MKKIQSFFFAGIAITAIYMISVLSSGCAQIGMPVGGPKDSLPPVLLNAVPPNFTVDFKGNRITLTFDEYVQLDNPIQNVLVSPIPKKTPFIDFKLKTVTVKLYDTLQPDKTYSLQFGNAIRDLNENNPFSDFDYVFSTGDHIDSLSVGGSIQLAETGKTDSTLVVMLYSDLGDSAVFKQKPEYMTKLDKEGRFGFRYLSPGTYNIFALKDEGGQLMYNNPEQLFAFYDDVIELKGDFPDSIRLYAYQEEKPQPKPSTEKSDTALKVSSNLTAGAQDLLSSLILTFTGPLKSFDSSKAILTDTLFQPLPGVTYSLDTTGKKVSVHYDWKGGENFLFLIPEDVAEDTNGLKLAKSDTLKIKTKNESDYGSLKLTFSNLEKYKNPVLQLVTDKGDLESFPMTSNVFQKKLLLPGTYTILILEDLNENGIWDPGNYAERRQPELVHRLPETISIKANWDNERDVEL